MSLPFYIVDVFAEQPFAGNQLAVFLSGGTLTDHQMQALAQEMNFSETAFVESLDPGRGIFDLRIFSTVRELPFAGHPTIGSAFVIQQEVIRRAVERVTINLGIGSVDIAFDYRDGRPDVLWMRTFPPVLGRTFAPEDVLPALGLDPSEADDRAPIQEASAGLPFIIVPIKTLESVRKMVLSTERYYNLIERATAKAILAFAPEAYVDENQLNVRVFTEYYGRREDPATGSGNGALAAYLSHHRYFGRADVDLRAEQGYEVNRRSLLRLRATAGAEGIVCTVGGKVQAIAAATLRAPLAPAPRAVAGSVVA